MTSQKKNLISSAPFFLVKNIHEAAEYYRDVLGFVFETYWGEPESFCMPTRDNLTVMLKQVKGPSKIHPNPESLSGVWDAYFWANDMEKLFQEFKSNGAKIIYEPIIQKEYQMKEFAIADLDHHVLAFGQSMES